MAISMTGNQIRAIRQAFGLPIDQFARVIGVHAVTLNRWELTGNEHPKIDGMPGNILLGLRERLLNGTRFNRQAKAEAENKGMEIGQLLALGGLLLALAALLEFANAGKGR